MTTYECTICYSVNHVSRLQCQCCGTIPARYSSWGVEVNYHHDSGHCATIVAAIGVDRTERRTEQSSRRLVTVPADYYASE